MGKPRFTEVSEEVADMFLKANAIADRIDYLEKAKMCPCGSGKPKATCKKHNLSILSVSTQNHKR